jgi:protein dithiol oxidoreductase (disulfide-forming)
MKKFLLGAVAASVLAFSGNAMANFVAGQDYQVVAKPVKVEKPGMAVVTVSRWNRICRTG